MAFSPETNLMLLAVPIQSDYSQTLWFDSLDSQTSYFKGKVVDGGNIGTNFNFIKKDHRICIEGNIDKLFIANYMMYNNSNFGSKWFYCFIDRLEWASQNSTYVYFHTDCIQTWYFDVNWYDCYIIRAHQETDEAGDNIVPEDVQLATGGYDVSGYKDFSPDGISYFATCSSTGSSYGGEFVNGMYTGAQERTDISSLSTYVQNGLATGVSRVQQYPRELSGGTASYTFPKYPNVLGPGGYQPKNKKLTTGACLQAFVSAYGQELNFNQDFCNGDDIKLKFVCDKTSGMVTCFVENYSLPEAGDDLGISTMSMSFQIPESNWAYSQYKNDYNLHSGSNAKKIARMKADRTNKTIEGIGNTAAGVINAAGSMINPVGDVLDTGGAIRGVTSGIGQAWSGAKDVAYRLYGFDEISQDLAFINESLNAPAVGGLTQAGTYIVGGMTRFCYGYKIPPQNILERYDQYLTVYGYKQSKFMKPNFHARTCWTFIQCGMVNADGKFPQDDLNQIKAALQKGVFFWDNTKTFGDFSQDNSPAGSSST